MQQTKAWYHTVPGLFHGQKLRGSTPERSSFSPSALLTIARLKSAKILYLRHRIFNKIRQIHRFFYTFRQNLQILCRNQAPSRRPARRPPDARRARAALPPPGEKPRPLAALPHKKPGIHTKWMPGRNRLQPVRAARH